MPVSNRFLLVLGLVAFAAIPTANAQQQGDLTWEFPVSEPAYPAGEGPRVAIDEAHCNFHTAGERYRPFAELLRKDGYSVEASKAAFSAETLAEVDVLVIANALGEAQCEEWKLPTAPAFRNEEIDALATWTEQGGALLLIADHMPFPGANATLAARFGLAFIDGYARADEGGPAISFDRATGMLGGHPVTDGRSPAERVESVTSFTGQGFRALGDGIVPLMILPAKTTVYMQQEAGPAEETTPRFSGEGLLQGAVLRHGRGRVAVFGEAAMFTAQEVERDGETFRFGMNAKGAEDNPQFLLNVLHWLAGLLEPTDR